MKRKTAASLLIVLVLLLSIGFQSFGTVKGQTQNVSYIIEMSVRYSNPTSGTRAWNLTEEDRTISLFMNNTWQTVELVNSTFSVAKTKSDDDGNPVAVLQFPVTRLSSGENVSFSTAYRVVSKPRLLPNISEEASGVLEDIPENLSRKYTGEEGPWLISNSTIRSLAHSVAGNETKVLTIVKRLVSWIHSNIAYKVHEIPLYANETITEGKGDCDDQAILLITLSRVLGIPAYLQLGTSTCPTKKLIHQPTGTTMSERLRRESDGTDGLWSTFRLGVGCSRPHLC